MKRAASAVKRLGSVKGARVDVSALTREIECWVDFDDGQHPGQTRALFYRDTAARLALRACTGLDKHWIGTRTAK